MKPQKGWDGITHCEIISVEPLKHIAYTYRGEATGEKALACAGTSLSMQHLGYKRLKLAIVSLMMQMGWKKQLKKKLPKVLERLVNE